MPARPTPLSPLTDQEIAAVRRPYRAASLLPAPPKPGDHENLRPDEKANARTGARAKAASGR